MGQSAKREFSFPKEQRILNTKDYRASFDSGFKFLSPGFVFFAQSSERPRLGVVVSRKVGNAVCRNRVKRLLRESYRNLKIKPDLELVIVARHRSSDFDFSDVNTMFLKSLEKIRVLLSKRRERA